MKDFCNIVTKQCQVEVADYWKSLEIWLKSPHLINRRILTSTQLYLCKVVDSDNFNAFEWFESVKNHLVTVDNVTEFFFNSLKEFYREDIFVDTSYDLEDIDYLQSNDNVIYLRLAKLLPRHPNKFSQTLELSVINIKKCSVTQFFCKYVDDEEKKTLGFDYPFRIKYDCYSIGLQVHSLDKWENSANLTWLQDNFFLKILKWMNNENPKNNIISGSLKLVPSDRYIDLYSKLKIKYGKEMVKMWPENTDPLKFVYEDIAIATYLLLLWDLEREKLNITDKQSFLDLGCGNGLLVHILNSEGFNGYGIDLRKRKIWDLYPGSTKLKVILKNLKIPIN